MTWRYTNWHTNKPMENGMPSKARRMQFVRISTRIKGVRKLLLFFRSQGNEIVWWGIKWICHLNYRDSFDRIWLRQKNLQGLTRTGKNWPLINDWIIFLGLKIINYNRYDSEGKKFWDISGGGGLVSRLLTWGKPIAPAWNVVSKGSLALIWFWWPDYWVVVSISVR